MFQGGVRSRIIGGLDDPRGSGEGVDVSRGSAIAVALGFEDPASNSSLRLQIFFVRFKLDVEVEGVQTRNGRIRIFYLQDVGSSFGAKIDEESSLDEGCDEFAGCSKFICSIFQWDTKVSKRRTRESRAPGNDETIKNVK